MARRLILDTGVLIVSGRGRSRLMEVIAEDDDLVIAATASVTKRTVLTTERGANFQDLPGIDCIVVA